MKLTLEINPETGTIDIGPEAILELAALDDPAAREKAIAAVERMAADGPNGGFLRNWNNWLAVEEFVREYAEKNDIKMSAWLSKFTLGAVFTYAHGTGPTLDGPPEENPKDHHNRTALADLDISQLYNEGKHWSTISDYGHSNEKRAFAAERLEVVNRWIEWRQLQLAAQGKFIRTTGRTATPPVPSEKNAPTRNLHPTLPLSADPRWLDADAAGAILKIGPKTVSYHSRLGRMGQPKREGSRLYWKRSMVEKLRRKRGGKRHIPLRDY